MLRIKTDKGLAFISLNYIKLIILISIAAETKDHTFSNLKQFRFIMSQFCRSEVQVGLTGSYALCLTGSKSRCQLA